MRIALVGYGKMGKHIEKLALARGHEITHRIDSSGSYAISDIDRCDVAIEFTTPASAPQNLKLLFEKGIPTVTGTTGWHSHLQEVSSQAQHYNARFLFASNFSIGVHLAFAVNAYLAGIMSKHADYHCTIDEWHHTEKKDAPSGTAISFAVDIIKAHQSYTNWELQGESHADHSLPITAHRAPGVPGTHTISYRSSIDTIRLTHEAHNRDGFALGAIHAAEWLRQQHPGIYTMTDFLKL